MGRIIIAILAAGILAACDNGTTGPTATGGEVALEVFKHSEYTEKYTGEGYNFAKCEKVLMTSQASAEVDIGSFPASYPHDVFVYASGGRIKLAGEQISKFYLEYNESVEFELVTLDGKARYKIFLQNRKIGFDEKRNGMVSENIIRYKLLDT